jgi:hypothetical protein
MIQFRQLKDAFCVFFYYKIFNQGLKMKPSLSWRNNNPGNLRFSTFAIRHGATNESDGFAYFPDYKTGFAALVALLCTKTYREMTLSDAIHRYAPDSENNTENYIQFLEQEIGTIRNKKLSELDTEKLALAIQKFEGWIPE